MQKIPLDKAAPGMVLAAAVTAPSGMLLCGAGLTLTDSMIGNLRRKDIGTIVVEGHPLPGPAEKSAEQLLSELDLRLRRVRGDQLMEAVRSALMARIQRDSAPAPAAEVA